PHLRRPGRGPQGHGRAPRAARLRAFRGAHGAHPHPHGGGEEEVRRAPRSGLLMVADADRGRDSGAGPDLDSSADSDSASAAEHARQAGLDLPTLQEWLRGQLGPGELEEPDFLTGGTQNVLLGFTWNDERLIYRGPPVNRSEEHTSELQSRENLVC